MISNPDVDVLSQLVDEVRPMVGETVCINDLTEIMVEHYKSYEADARRAAITWWRMPHPDWSHPKQRRLRNEGRRWMGDLATTTQKCRERIHPPGYGGSSRRALGD